MNAHQIDINGNQFYNSMTKKSTLDPLLGVFGNCYQPRDLTEPFFKRTDIKINLLKFVTISEDEDKILTFINSCIIGIEIQGVHFLQCSLCDDHAGTRIHLRFTHIQLHKYNGINQIVLHNYVLSKIII
ncbi:hypothetical protein ACJX0J_031147 [Zea mays]